MYALPFRVVLVGLAVGVSYVLCGGSCYAVGYRSKRPRLKRFGRTLLTRSPAVILGVAIAYVLFVAGVADIIALGIAGLGALVPPGRALLCALDETENQRTAD